MALIELFLNHKKVEWKSIFIFLPVIVFFGLSVMGAFYGSTIVEGLKNLERYWSFLLIPIAFMYDRKFYSDKSNSIFLGLVWGCVFTLLVCYINLFYEMMVHNEPLKEFFGSQHVGHDFTNIADSHPTYLSLFVVTSILFLIQEKTMAINLKLLILFFLFFGLFQLANRMALLLFLMFLAFFILKRTKEYRHQLFILILGILLCSVLFNQYGSEYMKDRLFSKEALMDEKRFDRWLVSYEIFKENPFMGTGFEKIDGIRRGKYEKYGFKFANKYDLNAHNQFLEYLSRNGAFGGFTYAISIAFLFLLSIYKRDYLFSFLFFAFAMANFTESMLVRIKGIEYFAIFCSLFLCSEKSKERPIDETIAKSS